MLIIKNVNAVQTVLDILKKEYISVYGNNVDNPPPFMEMKTTQAYEKIVQFLLDIIEKYQF